MRYYLLNVPELCFNISVNYAREISMSPPIQFESHTRQQQEESN